MSQVKKVRLPLLTDDEVKNIVEKFEEDQARRDALPPNFLGGTHRRPKCKVCHHNFRREINAALLFRKTYPTEIAKIYELDIRKLVYHANHHLVPIILDSSRHLAMQAQLMRERNKIFPHQASEKHQYRWVINQYMEIRRMGLEVKDLDGKVVQAADPDLVIKALGHIRDTIKLLHSAEKREKGEKDNIPPPPPSSAEVTPEQEKELQIAKERRKNHGRWSYVHQPKREDDDDAADNQSGGAQGGAGEMGPRAPEDNRAQAPADLPGERAPETS